MDTCKVLDIGCGTGLIGKYLAEEGFKNVVGLDISSAMLIVAEQKGVYSKLIKADLTDIDEFPHELKNQYDIVCCSGLVNGNNMDYKLFEEFVLAAKQKGLVIFAARHSFIGEYWYSDITRLMETEGRLRHLDEEAFFKYDRILSSIGRFSKTPSKVYVYENLAEQRITWTNRD